jgi:hypothetical protein
MNTEVLERIYRIANRLHRMSPAFRAKVQATKAWMDSLSGKEIKAIIPDFEYAGMEKDGY